MPQAIGNKRLAEQIRTILGKSMPANIWCGECRLLRAGSPAFDNPLW